MGLKSIKKVWEAGTGTLVVTLPKEILTLQNIKKGDYVEIEVDIVEKRKTSIKAK